MKRRLNVVLVLVALVGLVFAVQQGLVKQTLSRQYERLAAEVGYLEPPDEGGVSVIALPTRDQMHFRWRIFVPASEAIFWKNRWLGGTQGDISVVGPRSFIANVRFRGGGENGGFRVWWGFEENATVMSMGGPELNQLLGGRWDEMQVEQLASDGRIVMKSGELSSLLRISMPDQMREEARKALSQQALDLYVPEFFHLQFGVKENKEKTERDGSGFRRAEG